MRVLLDENLPRALASELTGHDVSTVQAAGWSGTQNGELLRQARERFDALLTMDRGLPHQHNLSLLGLRVLIIRAPSNRMVHLRFTHPSSMTLRVTVLRRDEPVVPSFARLPRNTAQEAEVRMLRWYQKDASPLRCVLARQPIEDGAHSRAKQTIIGLD